MMGSSPPAQVTLLDLNVFVELMRLASDPKKTDAALEAFAQSRKQYDDAIAEANERMKAALQAENKAQVQLQKANASLENSRATTVVLNGQRVEIAAQLEALKKDRQAVAALRAEVEDLRVVVNGRFMELDNQKVSFKAHIQDKEGALKAEAEALDARAGQVAALQAEYEEKLQKIKALAA